MTDLQIREQIAAYIGGDLGVRDLEDRLEDVAWDASDEPARALVADALRLLAEHGNGDWTEDELRESLGALSRRYWFILAPKGNVTGSGSVVSHHQDRRLVAAGRLRVEGSV